MGKEMRVGVKSAWIQAVLGGIFLIIASWVTWWLTKSNKGKNESQVQAVEEQKVDSGAINNYNAGRDLKIENNTYNNLQRDSFLNNAKKETPKTVFSHKNNFKKTSDTNKKGVKYVFNEPVDNRGGAIGDNNTVNNYGTKQREADMNLFIVRNFSVQ